MPKVVAQSTIEVFKMGLKIFLHEIFFNYLHFRKQKFTWKIKD